MRKSKTHAETYLDGASVDASKTRLAPTHASFKKYARSGSCGGWLASFLTARLHWQWLGLLGSRLGGRGRRARRDGVVAAGGVPAGRTYR